MGSTQPLPCEGAQRSALSGGPLVPSVEVMEVNMGHASVLLLSAPFYPVSQRLNILVTFLSKPFSEPRHSSCGPGHSHLSPSPYNSLLTGLSAPRPAPPPFSTAKMIFLQNRLGQMKAGLIPSVAPRCPLKKTQTLQLGSWPLVSGWASNLSKPSPYHSLPLNDARAYLC